MNLSKDQVNSIINNAPSGSNKSQLLDGLVKRGYSLEGVNMSQARNRVLEIQKNTPLADNPFDREIGEEGGFTGLLKKGTNLIFGGGKLAQGAGQALASDGVIENLSSSMKQGADIEFKLVQEIGKNKRANKPTDRLEKALFQQRQSLVETQQRLDQFTGSLKTDKEVIGSALRLGTSALAPTVAGKAAGKFGTGATGVVAGMKQGAKVGAVAGGFEGLGHGAGFGLEENKDAKGVATSALVGGAVGAGAGGVLGGAIGAFTGRKALKKQETQELIDIIRKNPNAKVAQYKIDAGELVKDPLAKKALQQGFDPDNVAVAKFASKGDKKKMNRMLEIVKGGMDDPKFKVTNRPQDVLGDSMLERVKATKAFNKAKGNELNKVAKGLSGQQSDLVTPVQGFVSDLDELGVGFQNGKAIYNQQSNIPKGMRGTVDEIVSRVTATSDDALEMHKLKQYLYEQVDYTKQSSGMTGRMEGIIKDLARGIDDQLDTQFTNYQAVNEGYAVSRNALDEFRKLAGKSFDETVDLADANLGGLVRRISSNARSRTDLMQNFSQLDEIARMGGKNFDDDIVTQIIFANDLDRVFPQITPPKSFKGEIEQAAEVATKGFRETILDKATQMLNKTNPEDALVSMQSLLDDANPSVTFGSKAVNTAKANVQQGGFTMDLIDNVDYAGKPYVAVSPYPERSAVYTAKNGVPDSSFADFLDNNRDLLLKKDYAMGGWLDTDSSKFYLDVVVPVPKDKLDDAVRLGKDANQIAVFDLEDFAEIATGGSGKTAGAKPLAERQAIVDKILSESSGFKGGVAPNATTGTGGVSGKVASKVKDYDIGMIDNLEANVLTTKSLDKSGKWIDDPAQKAVILDSDVVKQVHPKYDPANPMALHKESSIINDAMFDEALVRDTSGVVKATSGGAGSGKSEVIVDAIKGEPAIILDGTLKNYDKAVKNFDKALEAGKQVEVHVVYPKTKLAYLFNQMRKRNVNDAVFIGTHSEQRKTMPRLFEKYLDNDNVNFKTYTNNTFGSVGKEVKPKDMQKFLQTQAKVNVVTDSAKMKNFIKEFGLEEAKKQANKL